ncbi:MAG: dTMP kinase [Parachlamydiaceae bacterium]
MCQMMSKDKSQALNLPHFITVEGGEGAGKTTLIKSLESAILSAGLPVLITREPGGTPFGEEVRRWLLTHQKAIKIGARAELMLFLAARAQHIEDVIAPAITAGSVVICDRFNDSTVAYQGAGRGLGVEWVRSLCNALCGATVPDLTFFLDIDPQTGLERTRRLTKEHATAGETDRIEGERLEFHQTVRQAFIEMSQVEPDRFHCIDATMPADAVAATAIAVLERKLYV